VAGALLAVSASAIQLLGSEAKCLTRTFDDDECVVDPEGAGSTMLIAIKICRRYGGE
jgi:hypothetical protein